MIACLTDDAKDVSYQEKANARLIAAAPDLLRVLDALAHDLALIAEHDGMKKGCAICAGVSDARAAIAKATG